MIVTVFPYSRVHADDETCSGSHQEARTSTISHSLVQRYVNSDASVERYTLIYLG